MGCLSSFEPVHVDYQVQHKTNQNQKETNQNPNIYIQYPDPKLFEFDPNFLKDCENIQKSTYKDSEYKGQIKNGKRNGKGIMRWKSGIEYQGEFKDGYR